METSSLRSRRHRNPQQNTDVQKESSEHAVHFFSNGQVQKKKDAAFFQAKLTIGQADDSYEREADAVADKVVNKTNGQAPSVQNKEIGSVQRLATPEEDKMPATNDGRMAEDKKIQEKPLQREPKKEEEKPVQKSDKKEEEKPVQKSDKKEEEKPVQKSDKKEEEKPVQKSDKKEEEKPVQKSDKKEEEKPVQKSAGKKEDDTTPKGKGVSVKEPFETRLAHIKEKGKPLPEKIRSKMEAEMQHDFSSVRIHDDATAAELAEEIHAQAFAQGHDIYFNVDKFNPETTGGAHLLAHELTHVIQQGAAPTKAHKK